MPESRTDAIAREAARLLHTGRASTIGEAVRGAADALGVHDPALMPGHGRVRKHAQAMTMQALGDEGYRDAVCEVWSVAERLMTALEESRLDVRTQLVGRAAEGKIDGGVTVHVRACTETPIGELAETLVSLGYDEPAFETAKTRLGPLDRMRLVDDGVEITLTRCLRDEPNDLFTGKPLTILSLPEVRKKLSRSRP